MIYKEEMGVLEERLLEEEVPQAISNLVGDTTPCLDGFPLLVPKG